MKDRLFNTLIHSARQALRARDLKEAERIVTRLGSSYPNEAASKGLELELLLLSGRLDEATSLADLLVTRFPGSAGIFLHAGFAAFRQKRYDLALTRLEESNKLYPSTRAKRWIGKTLTNMGRFDDAESLLTGLYPKDPYCAGDLAWLFERKGDFKQALFYIDKHLQRHPGDEWALSQQRRLRSIDLDHDDFVEQVETLEELGESIPEELIPRYIKAIVASGRNADARRFIADHLPHLSARVAIDLAWACHRLQLHDLAYDLFYAHLENRLNDFKFLNTLEFSAKRTGRVAELQTAYETLAPKQNALYGRAKQLEKETKS